MEREKFVSALERVASPGTQEEMRRFIREKAGPPEKDMPVCIGELAELTLELTRCQRGKCDRMDLLQELSHVQWAVWRLQDMFGFTDEDLRRALYAKHV